MALVERRSFSNSNVDLYGGGYPMQFPVRKLWYWVRLWYCLKWVANVEPA